MGCAQGHLVTPMHDEHAYRASASARQLLVYTGITSAWYLVIGMFRTSSTEANRLQHRLGRVTLGFGILHGVVAVVILNTLTSSMAQWLSPVLYLNFVLLFNELMIILMRMSRETRPDLPLRKIILAGHGFAALFYSVFIVVVLCEYLLQGALEDDDLFLSSAITLVVVASTKAVVFLAKSWFLYLNIFPQEFAIPVTFFLELLVMADYRSRVQMARHESDANIVALSVLLLVIEVVSSAAGAVYMRWQTHWYLKRGYDKQLIEKDLKLWEEDALTSAMAENTSIWLAFVQGLAVHVVPSSLIDGASATASVAQVWWSFGVSIFFEFIADVASCSVTVWILPVRPHEALWLPRLSPLQRRRLWGACLCCLILAQSYCLHLVEFIKCTLCAAADSGACQS